MAQPTELRASEERLQLALAATSEAVWEWNVATGEVQYCPRSLGYETDPRAHDVPTLQSLIHPDDLPGVLNAMRDHLEGRAPLYESEHRLRDAFGAWRWNLQRGRVVERDADGSPLRVVGVDIDISARKRSEAELKHRQAQLRSLATRVLLAEEHERRRIAVDLHDGLGQTLAVARLKLGVMRKRAASGELAERSEEIAGLVDDAIRETRSLSFELSCPVLHQRGLEAGLRSLGEQLAEKAAFEFRFEADPTARELGEEQRVVLYRAVRELLFNVLKHARAQRVELRVRWQADRIRITVADDGIGFAGSEGPERVAPDAGLGLSYVREGLANIGGSLAIDSAPGRGTQAALTAPIAGEAP